MQFIIYFLLLTVLVTAKAHAAEPAVYARPSQDGVRAMLLQHAAVERSTGSNASDDLAADVPEVRRGDNFYPETPNVMGARLQEAYPATSESIRRSRGLSPEERKALRRQIDEAGHDIYSRRR